MSLVKTVPVIASMSQTLHRRSLGVLDVLEGRLSQIMLVWFCVVGLASLLRIAFSPVSLAMLNGEVLLPYLLLIGAPLASLMLALRWFASAEDMEQPTTRLAFYGSWRSLPAAAARRHPLYGTSGIMVSLLVGLLMNIPLRATEYLMTMPAIPGDAPHWLGVLHFWMTFDVVLMSSLYAICFAAAFRRVPLFPRMLVLVWLLDIGMQLLIARATVAGNLPANVAAPLHQLLDKNVTKVMISVGLWLPYLLLSRRVNVTFRHRIPA